MRPTLIDRHIAIEFIEALVAIIGISALLIGLNVFFEQFEHVADTKPPLIVILLYVANRLPYEVLSLMPLVAMLGVLFGIGLLARNNELLAMHACGISYTRLCAPVAALAVIFSFAALAFAETLVPKMQERSIHYENIIRDEENQVVNRNVWESARKWVFQVQEFDPQSNEMRFPRVVYMGADGRRPVFLMKAERAELLEPGDEQDTWLFHTGEILRFDRQGNLKEDSEVFASRKLELPKETERLLDRKKSPEQMNLVELSDYIKMLRRNGINTRVYATDLHRKLSFPFSILVLTLVGFTIAVRAHSRSSMILAFGYGLSAGIVYYLVDAAFKKFGRQGIINPFIAGWSSNIIFFAVAAYLIWRVNRVRE